MTATVTPDTETAAFINAGIGRVTSALIAHGATEERAFEVAYAATMRMLATERPDIFEKYLLSMIAENPDLDDYVTDPTVKAAIDAHRAQQSA